MEQFLNGSLKGNKTFPNESKNISKTSGTLHCVLDRFYNFYISHPLPHFGDVWL